jgi:hypothetical protein
MPLAPHTSAPHYKFFFFQKLSKNAPQALPRDPTRLSLANLSLEGIFQCKQTELLRSIPV